MFKTQVISGKNQYKMTKIKKGKQKGQDTVKHWQN